MYKAEGKAPRKGFVSQICHCFNGWYFATLYSLINYLLRAASWAKRKLNILNAIKKKHQTEHVFAPPNSITKTKKKIEVDLLDFADTKNEGGENIRKSINQSIVYNIYWTYKILNFECLKSGLQKPKLYEIPV